MGQSIIYADAAWLWRSREGRPSMIVRWGLGELPAVLGELGVERPLMVTSERWAALELPVELRYTGVGPHADAQGVAGALAAARETGADALVPVGGGSAI